MNVVAAFSVCAMWFLTIITGNLRLKKIKYFKSSSSPPTPHPTFLLLVPPELSFFDLPTEGGCVHIICKFQTSLGFYQTHIVSANH